MSEPTAPALPRLIALCGNPQAGKTLATELLFEIGRYQLCDDGLPMRQMAMKYFGLTPNQVYTQEGKLETVELNGRTWTVREILGEIGNAFEDKFGADIIPMMSHSLQASATRYVMGSVRREQGRFWKSQGALVIEIRNPDAPSSQYEFDRFNTDFVDVVINNDFLNRGEHKAEARLSLKHALEDALGLERSEPISNWLVQD